MPYQSRYVASHIIHVIFPYMYCNHLQKILNPKPRFPERENIFHLCNPEQLLKTTLFFLAHDIDLLLYFRDAVIVTIINCSTSIFAGFVIFSVLGHMSLILHKDVSEVAQSGPGLAFVVYPEAIAQMPISPLWALLFFFMLLTLGLDTQFAMMEAVVTGLVDEYGKKLRQKKELVILALCVVAFFFGLTNITEVRSTIHRHRVLCWMVVWKSDKRQS